MQAILKDVRGAETSEIHGELSPTEENSNHSDESAAWFLLL